MAKDPEQRRSVLLRRLLLAALGSSAWMMWLAGSPAAATDVVPSVPPAPLTTLTQPLQAPPVVASSDAVDSAPDQLPGIPDVPAVPAPLEAPPAPAIPSAPLVPDLPAVSLPEAPPEAVLPELPAMEDIPALLPEVPALPGIPALPELPALITAPQILVDGAVSLAAPTPLVDAAVPASEALPTPAVVLQPQPGARELAGITLPAPFSLLDPGVVPPAAVPGPVNPAPAPPLHPEVTPAAPGSSEARGPSTPATGSCDVPDVLSNLPPPRDGPVTNQERRPALQPSFDPGSRPD
ncbi:hypothetical protein [Paenarthrobacter sp. AB444]|jgi:hypothetical protein|uniref:hypothetical protein n=1 Tax=Paenarthrobacter sp. AB444 TaxID=3025681 RepID=UPI0023656156|nr:hypothetical protein [Paenarthrobacter sp. AB444]MDD7834743.1 hypothetical protein [Paenarthrobacter sp. AB444]